MTPNEYAVMNRPNFEQLTLLCAPLPPTFHGLRVRICETCPRDQAWIFRGDKRVEIVTLMEVR